MSVIQSKRSESKLEFYYNAIQLRKEITLLLLRDFGIKKKIRNAENSIKGMNKIEQWIINHILQKYRCKGLIEMYPNWLLDHLRQSILKPCNDLLLNITAAYNIHPIIEEEAVQRRLLIDTAIGNCAQILQEMQYAISVLPVDVNKFTKYVDMIEKEEKSLKGWRKENNKMLKSFN